MNSSEKKQIVFLYTELAEYFLSCVKNLSERNSCEIHIVRWPVNKEAPFDFKSSEKIKIYDKENYPADKVIQLVNEINPDLIYCSGWIDKDYLKICKKYKEKIPVIVG